MKNTSNHYAVIVSILVIFYFQNEVSAKISKLDKKLGDALVTFSDEMLTVETGKVKRTWKLTSTGLQTVGYQHTQTAKEWCTLKPTNSSDWGLPKRITNDTTGEFVSLDCIETDDDKFTSSHLLVRAVFHYECGLYIKYLVRVYPDAPGIWTALEVKSDKSFSIEEVPEDIATYKSYGSNQAIKIARSEYLPIDFSKPNQRRYWGIYNNPGNRVNTDDMVKERIVKGYPIFQDEQNTWASGVVVEQDNNGLIIVKESNKTVNKYGHQTGSYFCNPTGLEVTGWGLKPSEITSKYKQTWATWTMLYSGGKDGMELALKEFDRVRYPVNLNTDMHILIDTWGSDWQNGKYDKIYGRENSTFEMIEKEIKSASDLGIDIVRIDDGWQEGRTKSKNSWHPNTKIGYDQHWSKINKLKKKYNVSIGLWAAIRFITPAEMLKNQRELEVATWKFDFDKLEDHDSFAERIKGVRLFIKESGYSTQTSWCPEYDDQRYGWYSAARECGPMYFQNIQNNLPNHLAYVPYITLRHHWMMAKYYNINDLQCHWQNPSRTNPKLSDANQHSQSYCAFSAFMASPSCFMLTQLLETEERNELRGTITLYKKYREELYNSYVFPIGEEPNNASWAGFQFYNPNKDTGYLMVFRELHNKQEKQKIDLRFLNGKKIEIQNLETGKKQRVLMQGKSIELEIKNPAGYKFAKYRIIK